MAVSIRDAASSSAPFARALVAAASRYSLSRAGSPAAAQCRAMIAYASGCISCVSYHSASARCRCLIGGQQRLPSQIPDQGVRKPPAIRTCLDHFLPLEILQVIGKRVGVHERVRGQDPLYIEACPDHACGSDHRSLPLRETAQPSSEDLLHSDRKPKSIKFGGGNREAGLHPFACSYDRDELVCAELKRKFDREERAAIDLSSKERSYGFVQRVHAEKVTRDLLGYVRWQPLKLKEYGTALTKVGSDAACGIRSAFVGAWRHRVHGAVIARRRSWFGHRTREQHDHYGLDAPVH